MAGVKFSTKQLYSGDTFLSSARMSERASRSRRSTFIVKT